MRSDRRGLAGLFDALIFLAIASLVSVSLLSALGGQQPHREVGSERTDIVHEVLLRSTVADVRGNPVAIEEAFKLGASGERYDGNISMVIDLLLPGSGWRWTVETASRSYAFGSEAVPGGPVYCSVVRAPIDGGEVVFCLQVWDQS